MRKLLLAVLASTLLAAVPAMAKSKSMLILSAAPVQAGKFERIIPLAREVGIELEYRFVDTPGPDLKAADLSAHDFVVIDAPYGAAMSNAQAKLSPLLPGVTAPWVWMQSGKAEAKGVPQDVTALLHRYWSNGGRKNFTGFLCQVDGKLFGAGGKECAPPVVFPDSGFYHPDHPSRIVPALKDYLAWKRIDPAKPPPVVGLIVHRSYIDADLTGFIDRAIRLVEKAGALALPIYVPAMGNGEITRLISLNGKPLAGVLVNTQIVLNSEGRKAEFEALGIPVIQAMPYRRGGQADWEQDQIGVATQDIPFYLAQPEYTGITDPIMAAFTRKPDGDVVAIESQLQAVIDKAMNLIRLQKLPNAEKKVAIFFYNYPPGEKNLGASFLNVPKSLETVVAGLAARSYTVEGRDADTLTEEMTALLKPFYRGGELRPLQERGLADRLSFKRYNAWFEALPAHVRQPVLDRWGPPERSAMASRDTGERFFVIPRLQLGNIVILPQPPRSDKAGGREKALYHDTKVAPSHAYLATYLWMREQFGAHALVHFGTHGTAEWQPGKERGLSIYDYPYLVLGDTPVIYPYIVDNIGEALQTKRRGRAVTISHATPPFAPAGLHGDINRLHDLLHTWQSMTEGEVRAKTAEEIRTTVAEINLDKDMGSDGAAINGDFQAFIDALHIHLHDLALQNQPLGLAHFGQPADEDLRLFTVMQMLGKPFLAALDPEDPEEMIVGDYTKLKETPAWTLLDAHVRRGEPYRGAEDMAALIEKGRGYWQGLTGTLELENFLAALDGRLVPTSYGGDPIKNPDALPTGRNLYGFDPSRVPTKQAWEAGREAAEKLIAQHREAHGAYPDKLAFSLWSVETMRHFGILEAQALAVMGFRPLWDDGGRVVGVEPIPAAELNRPRVDAVISATGLYRDHFPNVMKLLAEAAATAGDMDEPGNFIAANTRTVEAALTKQGLPAEEARRLAQTRVFSSESGAYGTGLDNATLASDTWGNGAGGKEDRQEADRKLADLYLGRMQYAYGPDEKKWGEKPPVNAYAEHLKGVKGAVLSRTSNLYGMLTTDDPFQYLGGIGLAVRHLSGQSPELYISNLRDSGNHKTETAAGFLAKELRSRYFHPQWIEHVQKEGYSGALQVLDTVNNLWGWQATAPETVRDDQWQELKAVYVDDKYNMGLNEWFEKNHPHAQAQIIERMLEAARKEYWQTDAKTLADLGRRWQELAERYDIVSENQKFRDFVNQAAAGYGLDAPSSAGAAAEPPNEPAQGQTQQVQGQKLEKVEVQAPPVTPDWAALIAFLLMTATTGAGSLRQARRI